MTIVRENDNLIISDFGKINLPLTLDCGQAFRWEKRSDGFWHGVTGDFCPKIRQEGQRLYIKNVEEGQDLYSLLDYLDLYRDYSFLLDSFCKDEKLYNAIQKYGTIRILNQDPWETLCSFIISACNHIPRIKSIIRALCCNFGQELEQGEFSFPSAEKIASLSLDEISVIRAGYRHEYILDAARLVASGQIDFSVLRTADTDYARCELMKIKGVGKKVADCTLLFGLRHADAFPTDRHIKRFVSENYPSGLPECISVAPGIAQQYMFCIQREQSQG